MREHTIRLTGYCPTPQRALQPGAVTAWFGTENGFEMLTLEFGSLGQISVPYQPIAGLLRAARQNLV